MNRPRARTQELATLMHDQLDALRQSIDDSERMIDINRWISETRTTARTGAPWITSPPPAVTPIRQRCVSCPPGLGAVTIGAQAINDEKAYERRAT